MESRIIQYKLLSEVARDLIDQIYHNQDGFVRMEYLENIQGRLVQRDQIHPLEPYIINYDDNMEHEGILISLGARIGFNIKYDQYEAYEPAVQFSDRCSYTIRHNTSERIEQIMNMNEEDFEKELLKHGVTYNSATKERIVDSSGRPQAGPLTELTELYLDRLNIDSHKYNRHLINSYKEDADYEETTDVSNKIVVSSQL